MKSKWE